MIQTGDALADMVRWKLQHLARQAVPAPAFLILLLAAHLVAPVNTAERNEAYQESRTLDILAADIPQFRKELAAKLKDMDVTSERTSAGIVITGGAPDIFAKALFTIKFMRKELHCQLPVEIMYFGDNSDPLYKHEVENLQDKEALRFTADLLASALTDVNPLKLTQRRPLMVPPGQGGHVRLVDLGPIIENLGVRARSQRRASLARIVSITASSFDKVICLDADTIPLQDPGSWLDWEDFKAQGAIFWSDFHAAGSEEGQKELLWTTLGLEAPWKTETHWKNSEQGAFMIDRRRHEVALAWATYLITFSDVIHQYVPQYEDVWELAFTFAGSHPARAPYPARAAMTAKREEVYDLVAVVQNSPQGIPVFLRRVNNARFDLSTPGFAKMEWLTIGLPDAGWRAFAYHNDSKSFGIHDESTIYPHDSNCDCVDRYTANLFTEKEPKRWQGCLLVSANLTRPLPVALLPTDYYNSEVSARIKTIERAASLLQSLTAARLQLQQMAQSPQQPSHHSNAKQAEQHAEPSKASHDASQDGNLDTAETVWKGTEDTVEHVSQIDEPLEATMNAPEEELEDLTQEDQEVVGKVDGISSRALGEGLKGSMSRKKQARLQMRRRRIRANRLKAHGL